MYLAPPITIYWLDATNETGVFLEIWQKDLTQSQSPRNTILRNQNWELQKSNTDSKGTNIPVEVIAVGDKVVLIVDFFANGVA